ncbi:MAG: hypothetical protein HYX53_07610 [Chloroflexi bacterium]|nr:hypothetical protein [Chloroflexota bacterium]
MLITVWRDFDTSREPARARTGNHKRKLSEFICHLHRQNYFTAPHRVVVLNEWDVNEEAIDLWARVRQLIARAERDPATGPQPMQPLFLYADELAATTPTPNNLAAAKRDLLAAVGTRAALSRTDSEKDLSFA